MRRLLFAAILFSSSLHAQSAPDWNALQGETVRNLQRFIRINTTNPPGNEIDGARFLKELLDREGIEATILDTVELGPRRANLYARLKGNGSKKGIALVQHLDVVPATTSAWTTDPFGAEIKDGYVYGRGALDMKGQGMAHVMALIALKRSGVTLNRDIIIIANANEESGGTGAEVFVKRHPELLRDVEYLFNEGGDNPAVNGVPRYYGVGVEEKRAFWLKLVVKGVPSHGSRPTKLNPVPKLVTALARIAHYETPLRAVPGVARYFKTLSSSYSGEQRAWLSDVSAAIKNPRARAWITNDVYWNAILRNTISLTELKGSDKTNVIPAEASASLDIRLLPDQDPAQFLADIKRVIADTSVDVIPIQAMKPPLLNPIDTDLFRAIERATHDRDPAAKVTTPMFTAATDRPYYRTLGVITYGFDPFKVESTDMQKGMHGNDERISIENLGFGVRYLYDILKYAQ